MPLDCRVTLEAGVQVYDVADPGDESVAGDGADAESDPLPSFQELVET